MKTTILRYALALLFCLTAGSGWGQEEEDYIINEDFSELQYNGAVQPSYNNWTLSKGCLKSHNVSTSNTALRFEDFKNDKSKTVVGYAYSPQFNYTGDVLLSFSYARGASSKESTIIIDIEDGGVFDDYSYTQSIPVTEGHQGVTFFTASYSIFNTTATTRIKFSEGGLGQTFVIDDVIVRKAGYCLRERLNNDKFIENYDNIIDVNTERTLTGGIWNTLCLPFDVTMNDMVLALGKNQNIQLRTFSSYADNVLTFANANETTIPAGTPFLVKLNTTVKNPTFHAVTISNTNARSVTNNGVSFKGTYSPLDLTSNNPDSVNLFLTKQNTLAIPAASSSTMNGLRAYFTVSSEFTPAATRIAIDDETTALQPATMTRRKPTVTYDLNGQRTLHPRHGLYVVDGRLTFVK